MKFIQKISNTLKTYYFNMLFLFLPLDFLCIKYFIIISRKLRLIVEPFITFLFITFSYLYIKHSFITKICNEEHNIFKKIIDKIKQLPIYKFIIPILALLPLTTNLILWFYLLYIYLFFCFILLCKYIFLDLILLIFLCVKIYKNQKLSNITKSLSNEFLKRYSFNIFIWLLLIDSLCLVILSKHIFFGGLLILFYFIFKSITITTIYFIENKKSKFITNHFIIHNKVYSIFSIISCIFSIITNTIFLYLIMCMFSDCFITKLLLFIAKIIFIIFKYLFSIFPTIYAAIMAFPMYITAPLH